MTRQRIIDTSTEDLQKALESYRSRRMQLEDVPCKWCGTVFRQNRHWQRFCSAGHQVLWHQNEEKLYIEKLEGMVARLEREKAELQLLLIQTQRKVPKDSP